MAVLALGAEHDDLGIRVDLYVVPRRPVKRSFAFTVSRKPFASVVVI
jgi:hypothetical protein